MTPLLTEIELAQISNRAFDVVQAMPDDEVTGETWDSVYGRAIEQAVMRKAYRKAAEVCEGNTLRSTKFYGEYEKGVDAAAKHCRDSILKLMEE